MSMFSCPVVEIGSVDPVPGADNLDVVGVLGYRVVTRKGQWRPGDLAVYVPEGAVLPADLLDAIGLRGKLAGAEKNRVKAVRLRGCLSQGLLVPVPTGRQRGDDCAASLGAVKWDPPDVRLGTAGDVLSLPAARFSYDVENVKAWPDVLVDGEKVEYVEKVHGTLLGVGVIPHEHPDLFDKNGVVFSKGLGAKGLFFKNNEVNRSNLYVKIAVELEIHRKIREAFPGDEVYVLGEVYGPKIQDLTYGQARPSYGVFDVHKTGYFLDRDELAEACRRMGLPRLPVLYRGPHSVAALSHHTSGVTTIGGGAHVREGVVVTPLEERDHPALGRVALKSVSGDYSTRAGKITEWS